jgi:hypothetical protein
MIDDINEANSNMAIDILEELKRLENEKQKVISKINNLLDTIEDGQGNDAIKGRIRQNSDQQKIIENRLKEVKQLGQKSILTPEQVDDVIAEYTEIIKKKPPEGFRSLANTFIDKVTIDKNNIVKINFKISVRAYMVPRTGIEPVRRFLSDGF